METMVMEKQSPQVRGVTRKVSSVSGNGKKQAIKVSVQFKVDAPGAKAVHVAGSFNAWNTAATPMSKTGNGWEAQIELPRGRHEYRFIVDGEWMADPNARESAPNPFGGVNSVVSI